MPDLDIGVDANGTYESASDPVFEQLAELGVTFVEQPFRADDLATHSELRNRGVIPVALDESLDLADRATEAIETRSADMLSIKLNRHGWGTFERLRTAALDHQLEIRVGGTFDTSIGRRHLLAAATLPGVVDAAVGPPAAYLATDPSDYPEMEAGFVLPSHDAGIGCDPDPMTMEQITIQRLTVEM
jgi:L-alanine-DL-glutamate epimerase-like enolase superfamily enzyme